MSQVLTFNFRCRLLEIVKSFENDEDDDDEDELDDDFEESDIYETQIEKQSDLQQQQQQLTFQIPQQQIQNDKSVEIKKETSGQGPIIINLFALEPSDILPWLLVRLHCKSAATDGVNN